MRYLCIGLLACLPHAALADTPVLLTQPKPLAPDADALPRLDATDNASQIINTQLAMMDSSALNERSMCLAAGALSDWSRSTYVTFAGPDFLSLEVFVGGYCDGAAHPFNYQRTLTVDLRTGEPLDWHLALPGAFVNAAIGKVQPPSAVLSSLFVSATSPWDPDCQRSLTRAPLAFHLWLDSDKQAIAMAPASLAYVEQACSDVAYLTRSQMQNLGVDARLFSALANANPIFKQSP
jgi:hypothetical protein